MLNAHSNNQDLPEEITPWGAFDYNEYAWRNYGKQILEEDHLLILKVIHTLKRSGCEPASWQIVADVGTGPNIYPAMLLAPFVKRVKNGGRIDLIEYSSANRAYIKSVLEGTDSDGPLAGIWDKYEKLMAEKSPLWNNAVDSVRQKATVIAGSVFELPKNYYDAISSYFCPESITEDIEECQLAVHNLIDSVKHGGFIMVAHMLGSTGYPAGISTHFPAVPLTLQDLERMYAGRADVEIVQVNAAPGARPGYHGMAIAVGTKLAHGKIIKDAR